MPESINDEQAAIERLLLWEDIVATFRSNASILGIQAALELPQQPFKNPTRLVLEAEPDDEYTIQLWGEVGQANLIGKATLLFKNEAGHEAYNYEITPNAINQHSDEPTPLDREDLEDLRADLTEARWSEQASRNCAQFVIFFC